MDKKVVKELKIVMDNAHRELTRYFNKATQIIWDNLNDETRNKKAD